MMPATSWPSVNGHGSGFGQWPARMCRSVPHTPHAATVNSAALRGTAGRATLRITGGAPGPSNVATRICCAVLIVSPVCTRLRSVVARSQCAEVSGAARTPGYTWLAPSARQAGRGAAMDATYSLVIRNGTIHDGTGRAPFVGDVALAGDRIAAVGTVDGRGAEEIDAKNLLVTPGFVDI